MPYIDSDKAKRRHRDRQDYIHLVRGYFEGDPYSKREGYDEATYWLWNKIMSPSETDGATPVYFWNLAEDLLTVLCNDVLPSGAKVSLKNISAETRERIWKQLLNFGGLYGNGTDGLLDWARMVIIDVAQGGDGLIVPRLLPETESTPAMVKFDYYPAEFWQSEIDPVTGEPEFFRIEYRYLQENIGALGSIDDEYWYRQDIYADRIVNYHPMKIVTGNRLPPLTGSMMRGIVDTLMPGKSPTVMTATEQDGIEGFAEAYLFAKVGRNIAVPVMWSRQQHGAEKGSPELLKNKLNVIDAVQRELKSWIDAAHDLAHPPLTAIDIEVAAKGPGGPVGPRDQGNDDEKGRRPAVDLGPGAQNMFKGRTNGSPWIGYPQNLPDKLLHEDVIRFLVDQCFFGPSAGAFSQAKDISHFGDISGFSADVMEGKHNEKVEKVRSRVLGAIAEALNIGLKLLRVADAVKLEKGESLTDGHGVEFLLGKSRQSADEIQKTVIAIGLALDRGVPVRELMKQWPWPVDDEDEFIKQVEEKLSEQDPLRQQLGLEGKLAERSMKLDNKAK